MFLVSYLAHDAEYTSAVQERLARARPPMTLVTAQSAPELIGQTQTLPIRAVIADVTWPRETWTQLLGAVRQLDPAMPVLALATGPTEIEWWLHADELLRLDERVELFLHRLERAGVPAITGPGSLAADTPAPAAAPVPPPAFPPMIESTAPLLGNPQFRQFAEIFTGLDESILIESFIAWVQQACQTPRAIFLLREPDTGNFVCRAQRGLPSTLVPHYNFSQTSPLIRWLATTARILLRHDDITLIPRAVLAELELLQAVAAVPILDDGQLVAVLGIGPRLVGSWYSATELEALFAIGAQVAMAVHHCGVNRVMRLQQKMTERMLDAMPTGTVVLGVDNRIAFINPAAAMMLNRSRASLQHMDLRVLPSPLGDLAYESLISEQDLPRREIALPSTNQPVAVTCFALEHDAAQRHVAHRRSYLAPEIGRRARATTESGNPHQPRPLSGA